jgi:hypothetical protein
VLLVRGRRGLRRRPGRCVGHWWCCMSPSPKRTGSYAESLPDYSTTVNATALDDAQMQVSLTLGHFVSGQFTRYMPASAAHLIAAADHYDAETARGAKECKR